MANYPTTLPSSAPATHVIQNDEVVAIATELGTLPKGTFASVEARLTAGAQVVLAQTVLAATAASIDFTSIAATYESLRVVMLARTTAEVASIDRDGLRVRLNNDATAVYDSYGFYANGSTMGVFNQTAQTSGRCGDIADLSSLASVAGQIDMTIAGYARTTWQKNVVAHSHLDADAGVTADRITGMYGVLWHSTAAVNRVTIYPESLGNFAIGTVATLYGIKGL